MLEDQRQQGRRIVLAEIRKAGRVARVDLARATGISQATVTTITAELIREGLIEEVQPETTGSDSGRDARRGRPRVDLRVRGAAHKIAGLKISNTSISLVLIDYVGNQIAATETPLEKPNYKSTDLVPAVCEALAQLAGQAGIKVRDISGIGIGLSGVVDAEAGVVYWSPTLKDRNVHLLDMIAEAVQVPVFVDNDANLVAMAEMYFGYGREVKDFLVVTVETGVGMGIVLNGEIYRGTRGRGSEFGHTKVQLDGALCRCGQRGCLEAYVSDYALLREASVNQDFRAGQTPNEQVRGLINAAKAGDKTAATIIQRAGRMFAMGLANLVNIFDPELIILSGERMQSDFLYADEVISAIRESSVQVDLPPPEVIIHKWGDQMWAMGAAAYAINGVDRIALHDVGDNAA